VAAIHEFQLSISAWRHEPICTGDCAHGPLMRRRMIFRRVGIGSGISLRQIAFIRQRISEKLLKSSGIPFSWIHCGSVHLRFKFIGNPDLQD
jgi:hypothetical protein